MDSILDRLQQWYVSQCDGDWDHDLGVRIESLDNPGWIVKINVAGTALEGASFAAIQRGLNETASKDWYSLSIRNNVFEGAGDPSKLTFILRTFLDWAERPGR